MSKVEPAFPTHPNKLPGHFSKDGLTKREYFAAQIAAGMYHFADRRGEAKSVAQDAVEAADALIAALERKPE